MMTTATPGTVPAARQGEPDPAPPAEDDDTAALGAVLERLFWLRRASGLTQAQVAARMGVRQASVSALERRKTRQQFQTVQRYARALGARLVIGIELLPEQRGADRA
jgi:DNA-binding XRE family transcriptional regulator